MSETDNSIHYTYFYCLCLNKFQLYFAKILDYVYFSGTVYFFNKISSDIQISDKTGKIIQVLEFRRLKTSI